LLAGVVHLELLLVLGLLAYFHAPRASDLLAYGRSQADAAGERIEIEAVDEELARKLLAELERDAEKAKEEEVRKEIESPEAPGQVVDLAKPQEERRPENARFAAEHDVSVEKETKKNGRFDQQARQASSGTAESTTAARPAAQAQPAPPQASAPMPGALALRSPGSPGTLGVPRLTLERMARGAPGDAEPTEPSPQSPDGVLPTGGQLQLRPPAGQTMTPGGGPPPAPATAPGAALAPTREQVARAIGSGTEDYLRDVDDGDETLLSAKKWRFATFFNRVKAQVREQWHPAEVYRRRDPTGAIYGNKDRYTLLKVELKPDGSLSNVYLQEPSGIEFLDDEAIEAFKQAQPFPNPPRALVKEGTIQFSFGFFFELSGAPRMRVFRYDQM
jgi:TonB family protein